jgi:hypothetical protein
MGFDTLQPIDLRFGIVVSKRHQITGGAVQSTIQGRNQTGLGDSDETETRKLEL